MIIKIVINISLKAQEISFYVLQKSRSTVELRGTIRGGNQTTFRSIILINDLLDSILVEGTTLYSPNLLNNSCPI